MRFSTLSATAALVSALSLTPMTAFANQAKADRLAKIEANGLAGVGAARLKLMLPKEVVPVVLASAPASGSAASSVKFTQKWLSEQPKASGGPEWRCLAEALYFEARGETIKGQFAVAEVIRNRVRGKRFPGSFCAVINQGTGKKYQCQFTYTCDGRPEVINEPRAFERVGKIARATLDGNVPALTDGAQYYHTTAVNPSWASVFKRTAKIGVHLFYRQGKRVASN